MRMSVLRKETEVQISLTQNSVLQREINDIPWLIIPEDI